MDAPAQFVQVGMPGEDLVLAAATRRRGRSADILVEGVVRPPAEPVFRARAILGGLSAAEAQGLAQALQARYGRRAWQEGERIAYDLLPDDLPAGIFDVLLAFQASFGPAWLRFAEGRLTVRAQATGCTPQECAARLRQALRLASIRRQVRVVEVAGEALRPWHALLAWRAQEEPLVSARVARVRP